MTTNPVANVLIIIAMIAWIGGIVALLIFGAIECDDRNRWTMKATLFIVGAVLLLAIPLGIIASRDEPLCRSGHEDYRLVGKTYQRVWICDVTEAK